MEIRHNIVTYAITLMILVILTSFRVEVLAADQAEMTVKITAKKFEYSPNEIRIKKGIPVILEFTSLDRVHGFFVSDLGGGFAPRLSRGKSHKCASSLQKPERMSFIAISSAEMGMKE